MLGALFLIAQELTFQTIVFFYRNPSFSGPGYRSSFYQAVLDPDEHFRRGANDGELLEIQKIHVGRWIDDSQGPIEIPGIYFRLLLQPLREHDLEYIPFCDILPRSLDASAIVFN